MSGLDVARDVQARWPGLPRAVHHRLSRPRCCATRCRRAPRCCRSRSRCARSSASWTSCAAPERPRRRRLRTARLTPAAGRCYFRRTCYFTNMPTHPHSTLTKRERQIMDALYRRGRATAGEIMAALPGSPSYSTVRTQLRVLEGKGHVSHEVDGVRFVYTPTMARRTARRSALKHLVDTFFEGSSAQVVAALLGGDGSRVSADELERIEALVRQRPGGGPMNPLADAALRASIVLLIGLALRGRPAAPLPGAAARGAGRGHRRRSRGRADRCRRARRGRADRLRRRAPGGDRRTGSSCRLRRRDSDGRDGCRRPASRDPMRRSAAGMRLDDAWRSRSGARAPPSRSAGCSSPSCASAAWSRRQRWWRMRAGAGRSMPSAATRRSAGPCACSSRRTPAARDVGLAAAARGDPRVRAGLERRARADACSRTRSRTSRATTGSLQSVAETLRALLWWNPLAWLACRALRDDSELACDDAVLAGRRRRRPPTPITCCRLPASSLPRRLPARRP